MFLSCLAGLLIAGVRDYWVPRAPGHWGNTFGAIVQHNPTIAWHTARVLRAKLAKNPAAPLPALYSSIGLAQIDLPGFATFEKIGQEWHATIFDHGGNPIRFVQREGRLVPISSIGAPERGSWDPKH